MALLFSSDLPLRKICTCRHPGQARMPGSGNLAALHRSGSQPLLRAAAHNFQSETSPQNAEKFREKTVKALDATSGLLAARGGTWSRRRMALRNLLPQGVVSPGVVGAWTARLAIALSH